jgi:transcriptional regulator with XRE-family HTH domain
MTYNEALRKARLSCGFSQTDVATRLGVSKNQICKWEKGVGSKPNLNRLMQLADTYETSIDELIGRT